MGCIALPSAEKQLSPQEMQERQRQIMLDRQREFERKRELNKSQTGVNNASAPAAARPISTKSSTAAPRVIVSASMAPATASNNSSTVAPKKAEPVAADEETPPTEVVATTKTVEEDTNVPSTQQPLAMENPAPVDAGLVQMRTINANDSAARRSKNVHDLAMYGKDVTRRASFNPRPNESPFTPEMQLAMKKGHEAMVAEEEARKKQERLREEEGGGKAVAVTTETKAEEEEGEEEGGFSFGKEKEKAEEVQPQPQQPATVSESGEAMVMADAKFVVRNREDRLSKNAHDMSQYMSGAKNFNRRHSFQPQQLQQQQQ